MAQDLQHTGFLIPNAGDVSNPRMAEPDRVDFNTLAHPLWGVIEGCKVSVVGSLAQTDGGTLLVNGQLVTMAAGSVALGISTGQDRFDLVVCKASGIIHVIVGAPAVDPVFPDPPLDSTVLAAVFSPGSPGGGGLSENVIDKRKLINKALLTKIGTGEALVRNLNGTGNHYLVDGGGKTTWENDTWLGRAAPETLQIHKHLQVDDTLTAGWSVTAGGPISATGYVTGVNLQVGTTTPPLTPSQGSLWQNTGDGRVSVWRGAGASGAWKELATIESAMPPGTVITSFEKPSVMRNLGWLPLDGTTVYESAVPSLFTVQGLAHLIQNTTPSRSMALPNAQKLVFTTDFSQNPGTKISPNPGNQVALKTANMPPHKHNPRTIQAGGASPRVTISRVDDHRHGSGGGLHGHLIEDPGHRHNGFDYAGLGASVICVVWGGQNKIDALFNDRNHTFSVEPLEWTKAATTGITVRYEESGHGHDIYPAGGHDHIATVDGIPDHIHAMVEDQVGNGTPFDITPESLVVYSYIRT